MLAAVFGPHAVTRRSELREEGALVVCEYSMAAFSTGEGATGLGRGLQGGLEREGWRMVLVNAIGHKTSPEACQEARGG